MASSFPLQSVNGGLEAPAARPAPSSCDERCRVYHAQRMRNLHKRRLPQHSARDLSCACNRVRAGALTVDRSESTTTATRAELPPWPPLRCSMRPQWYLQGDAQGWPYYTRSTCPCQCLTSDFSCPSASSSLHVDPCGIAQPDLRAKNRKSVSTHNAIAPVSTSSLPPPKSSIPWIHLPRTAAFCRYPPIPAGPQDLQRLRKRKGKRPPHRSAEGTPKP